MTEIFVENSTIDYIEDDGRQTVNDKCMINEQ